MEHHELEGIADELFQRAGIDPASAPGVLRLLMQSNLFAVHFSPSVRTPRYRPANDDGPPTIEIPQVHGLRIDGLNWLGAHEVGEYYARRVESEDRERVANAVAASIVAPRSAMRRARERWGIADLSAPAARLAVSETVLALRHGELWETPVAVIWSGGRVVRRGIDGDVTDAELRRIARAGGCEELRAIPLTDARRVALVGRDE